MYHVAWIIFNFLRTMQFKIPFFSRLFELLENYCIHVSKALFLIVFASFWLWEKWWLVSVRMSTCILTYYISLYQLCQKKKKKHKTNIQCHLSTVIVKQNTSCLTKVVFLLCYHMQKWFTEDAAKEKKT